MATTNQASDLCCKCMKDKSTSTCDGCHQSFCTKHMTEHGQELMQEKEDIRQQYDVLRRDIDKQKVNSTFLTQINEWEQDCIKKIRSYAEKIRADLKQSIDKSKGQFDILMNKLSGELRKSGQGNTLTENDIDQWKLQVQKLRQDLDASFGIELAEEDDSSSLRFIMVKIRDRTNDDDTDSIPKTPGSAKEKPKKPKTSEKPPEADHSSTYQTELPPSKTIPSISSAYLSVTFDSSPASDQRIQELFEHLMSLQPMDKNGPMSGRCEAETSQMEQFFIDAFGFRNTPGEYIVQGVKSFRLGKPPHSLDPNKPIHFPKSSKNAFTMTAREILQWQRSYRVYAPKNLNGMSKDFLYQALQGKSGDDHEAFMMKYVIRISTCPILMEFDAKLISRKLTEDWPSRIKLVSVTGIDFAGRKHDVGDILHFISNWRDIYEVDTRTNNTPALINDRDFCRRKNRPDGELHEGRLLGCLTDMARLRLKACDKEGVQIVVETGIGLGVFAGEQIGIADKVQITSALAIRQVLEQDGPRYEHIRAIIFALPIIDEDQKNRRKSNAFNDFVEQFQEPQYKGSIPVLIADQDMHRLTVAIARHGFVVSELNPADSHGVFGEYWQNRGPAVEEKLALTTLGLLVQHHLINPEVLNTKNYHFLEFNE